MSAISERVSYSMHNKITAFANRTPSAPLPAQPGAVYDLAEALQHVTIKLELDNNSEEEPRVVFLSAKEPEEEAPPPRKQIGFNREKESTNNSVPTHENSCAVKGTPEAVNLADAKQRLRMYKKRLGSHQQKATSQQKKSGKVCQRTADAIDNNKQWVNHYEGIISQLKSQG